MLHISSGTFSKARITKSTLAFYVKNSIISIRRYRIFCFVTESLARENIHLRHENCQLRSATMELETQQTIISLQNDLLICEEKQSVNVQVMVQNPAQDLVKTKLLTYRMN